MIRQALVAAVFGAASLASAQVPTLAALKASDPVQLSADELQQLIPGAKVISRTNAGSTRIWTNQSDGTLSAASDGRGVTGGRGYPSSATGTCASTARGAGA